jgi:hypothetical protein
MSVTNPVHRGERGRGRRKEEHRGAAAVSVGDLSVASRCLSGSCVSFVSVCAFSETIGFPF